MPTGDPVISFPGWELQKDEFSILGADATLTAAGWTVYDFPPESPSFPYIIVGQHTVTPQYYNTGALQDVTSSFHLYSEYKGGKEIQEATDALVQALTGGTFSLTGFTVVQVSLDGAPPIIREINRDRVLHHGIPRVRYLID